MRRVGLLLVLVAGCKADQPSVDDAPPIDGRPFPLPLEFDEGGEVRIEHVRFASGNAATRAAAFLYDNAGSAKFFPYPNLNGCTDTSSKQYWPTAENPLSERTYLDPGSVIIAGGPKVLAIPRSTAEGKDVSGRTHRANAWFFHFGGDTASDGPTYLTENTRYDVAFTGSANMPAQIFDDVLFMPADFDVLSPAISTTPFPLPAGTPQTFTWTTPPSNPPLGYEVQSLVVFTGANGPAVLCVEPNDGSITVPASMIDVVRAKYPNGGTLSRQTLTHTIRELVDNTGPTRTRIDFITSWSYETPFTVP